jgi:hypothetical protein
MGICVPALRKLVAWLMLVLWPLSLTAQDKGSAVLRSQGGVWVNGFEISGSTVIFPGDTLETKPGFVGNIDAEGSAVQIQPVSIVKFQGTFLDLEHGAVSVGTSTAMSVHVKCIQVDPLSTERTQYEVGDVTGTMQIAARKNDVKITQTGTLKKPAVESGSSQNSIVHEGQQLSRDESAVCGAPPSPTTPAHSLNTKWLEIGGGAAAAGIIICLLLCKGSSSPPVSPSQP